MRVETATTKPRLHDIHRKRARKKTTDQFTEAKTEQQKAKPAAGAGSDIEPDAATAAAGGRGEGVLAIPAEEVLSDAAFTERDEAVEEAGDERGRGTEAVFSFSAFAAFKSIAAETEVTAAFVFSCSDSGSLEGSGALLFSGAAAAAGRAAAGGGV